MIEEQLKITGSLRVELNGELVRSVPNLIVTTGKGFVASRMAGNGVTAMTHMAIGSSSTTATLADTSAGSEQAVVALGSTSPSGANVVYTAVFPAGTPSGASSITEAVIRNASSGGIMLCRTVFPVINKSATDSMTVIWTVTVS